MKDNKLIAEFMDWKQCDPNDNTIYANPTNGALHSSDSDMRFHTSWDWLMPVLSKCFKTGDDTQEWDNIMDTLFTCDIDIVYAQIVEFINESNN